MTLTFKPAQLLILAIRIAVLLALDQAVMVAAPPYDSPQSDIPSQYPAVRQPLLEAIPAPEPGPRQFLVTPVLKENLQAPAVPPAAPAATDRPLPINLATALCLSNARPLVIAFAQNSVELAAAQLQHAKVMWLPNFNTGIDYYRHVVYDQETQGPVINVSKSYFAAGAGATLDFGISDAIFLPLAARQELSSREFDLEAARNDALATVATTYFDVQEARGRLAGNLDAQAKAKDLQKQIKGLAGGEAGGLVPQIEVDRVLALQYDLEQEAAASRAAWQTSSARLNRVLRLSPGAVVVPIEPPQLQVTLIPPGRVVDDLIPVGLLNRPELASQKALVQATLERLRQERLRPLLPSVVLGGGSGPGGAFTGGVFEGSPNDEPYVGGGRFDVELGVVWTFENLGAGNRALVRERSAQQQRALLGLFDTQDRVAEEVVQAHAQLGAAALQVGEAEAGVREANITLAGTRIGLRNPRGAGGLLQLINRPQEAVAALQQLNRAYDTYFAAVNGYNRAQFQLYRAIGYPARILICDCPLEKLQEVDTSRPPCMAPVCPDVIPRP
jgi:outer membrane protein TolC